jgi:ubiquinone/menaquinone biosynthesis C-methylase UbiE
LEIGCGPAFLRNIFGEDYVGTDITNKPYNENLIRDVDVICSADQLLFEKDSFDIIVIKSAFFLFPNHELSLKEAKRVLKPGGKIIIFDYNRKTQIELQRKEGHTNYPCWTQWGLKRLIQRNGFQNVQNLIPRKTIPTGIGKLYYLIKQEIFGTWAIILGTK